MGSDWFVDRTHAFHAKDVAKDRRRPINWQLCEDDIHWDDDLQIAYGQGNGKPRRGALRQ
jgi:hypothetical protein